MTGACITLDSFHLSDPFKKIRTSLKFVNLRHVPQSPTTWVPFVTFVTLRYVTFVTFATFLTFVTFVMFVTFLMVDYSLHSKAFGPKASAGRAKRYQFL